MLRGSRLASYLCRHCLVVILLGMRCTHSVISVKSSSLSGRLAFIWCLFACLQSITCLISICSITNNTARSANPTKWPISRNCCCLSSLRSTVMIVILESRTWSRPTTSFLGRIAVKLWDRRRVGCHCSIWVDHHHGCGCSSCPCSVYHQ